METLNATGGLIIVIIRGGGFVLCYSRYNNSLYICSSAHGSVCTVMRYVLHAVTVTMSHFALGPTERQVHLLWESLQIPGREQEVASSLPLRGRHLQHRPL